jgi:hypothetical protein
VEVEDELEMHYGVVRDATPTPRNHAVNGARDEFKVYIAQAYATVDAKETEAFLGSRIQRGSKLYTVTDKGKVFGWYSLLLDSEAAKEV